MNAADPDIRRALSRAAGGVPLDVEERLTAVHRRGRSRSRLRRATAVIVAATVTVGALLTAALLFPLRRDVRPGPVAPSAGRIAYTSVTMTDGTLEWSAYIAAGDGSSATVVASGPGAAFAPAFSPDGESLAFVAAEQDASSPELWIAGSDGSEARPIVTEPQVSADSTPAWAPDGQRIAFIASERGGRTVWVVDSDGSDARRILEGSWSQVSWSRDGARLALAGFGQAGRPGLYVADADGESLARLRRFDGTVAFPTWSPHGDRIAFMALDPAGAGVDYAYDVFVVDADGSGLVRLTTWEGFDGFPVWSPDGSRILFSSDRGASGDQLERNRAGEGWFGASLYVMGSDGSEPEALLSAGDAALLPTSWVP
jgi:Tol biopolymer transport system component